MFPKMELAKHQHSTFHTPEGMIPTAAIPFVPGQPPGAQQGTPGMAWGGHGLVVNKVVLALWSDSATSEIFSNLNVPTILC